MDAKIKKLKREIITRFNKQLKDLKMGYPYKEDKTLSDAIRAVEYSSSCLQVDTNIDVLLDRIYTELKR